MFLSMIFLVGLCYAASFSSGCLSFSVGPTDRVASMGWGAGRQPLFSDAYYVSLISSCHPSLFFSFLDSGVASFPRLAGRKPERYFPVLLLDFSSPARSLSFLFRSYFFCAQGHSFDDQGYCAQSRRASAFFPCWSRVLLSVQFFDLLTPVLFFFAPPLSSPPSRSTRVRIFLFKHQEVPFASS